VRQRGSSPAGALPLLDRASVKHVSRFCTAPPVVFLPVLLNSTDRYNTGKKTPVKRHRYSTPFSRPFAQKWALRRSFDEDGYLSSVSTVQRYLGDPVQTPGGAAGHTRGCRVCRVNVHTGHTRGTLGTHGRTDGHTDHTDEPHNHPNPAPTHNPHDSATTSKPRPTRQPQPRSRPLPRPRRLTIGPTQISEEAAPTANPTLPPPAPTERLPAPARSRRSDNTQLYTSADTCNNDLRPLT